MQRRLSGTLAKTGIIDAQHRTAGPAEEFDIVQVRREIAGGARTKQDDRDLVLGYFQSRCLPYRLEPEAVQELALRVGESYFVGTQTKIRWHLIAIPIGQQDEGVEKAMQHCNNNT